MSSKEQESNIGPPSYEDVVLESQSSSSNYVQPGIQDEVHLELWRLAESFQQSQRQRLTQIEAQDKRALELLIPEIKNFLDDFSNTMLRKATLIIIPNGKIDGDAEICDSDLQSADEYRRIVKTDVGKKAIDFSTWNEAVKRLARHLQPRTTDSSFNHPNSQAEVVKPAKSTAKNIFGSKKSSDRKIVAATRPDELKTSLPGIGMDVKATEVTFRTQTLLGLYETQNVCGLVISIRVNAKHL